MKLLLRWPMKGKLSLTEKKLLSLVSRYLQEVLLIKVLKGEKMKLCFLSRLELIELKTNSTFRMTFVELSSAPNAFEMIPIWRSLPSENFPEL